MDRIWQWAWDRYGARYSWAIFGVAFFVALPFYLLLSFVVVAFEGSDRYVEAAAVTVVVALVLAWVNVLPGLGPAHLMERWAAGQVVDRPRAMDATYTYARGVVARVIVGNAVGGALLALVVAVITGAAELRLVQYAILGAAFGVAVHLDAVHSLVESIMRPVRLAIAGD